MTTQNPLTFTLSIEPTGKPAFQHSWHLGTDETIARQIAVGVFHDRNKTGKDTCTVALMRDRKTKAISNLSLALLSEKRRY